MTRVASSLRRVAAAGVTRVMRVMRVACHVSCSLRRVAAAGGRQQDGHGRVVGAPVRGDHAQARRLPATRRLPRGGRRVRAVQRARRTQPEPRGARHGASGVVRRAHAGTADR